MNTEFHSITIWQLIPMAWGAISPGILSKMPDSWSDNLRVAATIGWHALTALAFVVASTTPTLNNWIWFTGQTLFYTILSYLGIWNQGGSPEVENNGQLSASAPAKKRSILAMRRN